jgi:hypothetical protein
LKSPIRTTLAAVGLAAALAGGGAAIANAASGSSSRSTTTPSTTTTAPSARVIETSHLRYGQAAGVGFEPTRRFERLAVFKTAPFDRSGTPPMEARLA